MIDRINNYDWSNVHSMHSDTWEQHLAQFASFTTVELVSIYSDVCKQEQTLADTLQQPRLVALVNDGVVLRHTECMPNPHSAHRIR